MDVSTRMPTMHSDMLDILASPVIISDINHKVVKCNSAARQLLGLGDREIGDLYLNKVFAINPEHFGATEGKKERVSVRRHDGSCFTAEVSRMKAIFHNSICFSYSFRDLSREIEKERDHLRQTQKREKAEFAKMVTDNCRDAFITCGPNFCILKASKQVELLLGYSVEEFEQKSLSDLRELIVPVDRGNFDRAMEAIHRDKADYILNDRLNVVQFVARFLYKSGQAMPHEVVPIECVITYKKCLLAHQRQYFVGAVREITDRINEDKITIDKSVEEIRAKRIGASRFAHFLTEILQSPVDKLSELSEHAVQECQTTAEQQQALHNIRHCAGQIRRVTTDLEQLISQQAISQLPSAANFTFHEDSFSLLHIISQCVRQCHKQADAKKLSLILELGQDLPPEVIGDSCRLLQVLTNLTSNAIKFTTYGKVVLKARLKMKEEKKAVIFFEVIDTGIGIPQADISQLFQSFTQLLPGMEESTRGSGLGLSICRLFVDKMGGKIGVESKPGRGSTFYFELPFKLPETK